MLLLPRMLLHRPPRGGLIAKDKLHQRFQSFVRGEWLMLLEASGRCDEEAAIARRGRRHRGDDEGGSSRVEGGPRRVVVCQASFGGGGDSARHQGDVATVD